MPFTSEHHEVTWKIISSDSVFQDHLRSFSAIMNATGSARELLFGTKQLPQNLTRDMPNDEPNQQPKWS
jgi:hypothetical protein